jgi:hypothetical protein
MTLLPVADCAAAHARLCEGFRIAAYDNGWARLEAGVRKPPGKEPARVRKRACREGYGDLSYEVGVGLDGFGGVGAVEGRCRGAGRCRRMRWRER